MTSRGTSISARLTAPNRSCTRCRVSRSAWVTSLRTRCVHRTTSTPRCRPTRSQSPSTTSKCSEERRMTQLGDCEKCPLNDRPIVPGYGPKGGLMVVGEAPGASDARRGKPFISDAGALLREVLRACGQDPDEVYYTNTVIRHPLGNKTPGLTPIRACNDRLFQELQDVSPTKILSVGGVALTGMTRAAR